MRILILGGDGMLGHQLLRHFSGRFDTRVTLRQDRPAYAAFGLFTADNSYTGIDVRSDDQIADVMSDFRPQAVVNAVGVVKQRDAAKESIPSIEINALLPHRLAVLCATNAARLVHLSTDCVFSGDTGHYTEDSTPDAVDLYGRSKLLGEVTQQTHCVTLRTSIIGLELARKTGLIEWYLAQKGAIKGFAKAIYTGLTTSEMARVIERVLVQHPALNGVWHVASSPISKYDLLVQLTALLARTDVKVNRDEEFTCDRSLDAGRFNAKTGYTPPSWSTMLSELTAQIKAREGR